MAGLKERLRQRADNVAGTLSPKARQWALLGLLGTLGFLLLLVIFISRADRDSASKSGFALPGTAKPTNVDLMAPGSQMRDSEVWIGTAGRELERMRAEREEQTKATQELKDKHAALLERLNQMEERLKRQDPGSPPAPTRPAPAGMPPAGALPLPPSPPPALPMPRTAAMPPGTPGLPPPPVPAAPPQPRVIKVTLPSTAGNSPAAAPGASQEGSGDTAERETLDTFLPVSFTRGILLGGLDAPTGGQSQGNPHPVLIRLEDNSVLPNRFRAAYRECFVIGAGYGDISSERAYIRTERLSCVRPDGEPLELTIQGSIFGEDGKVGMRGRLVTKQGQMLANALLAGVVSGIGQGFAQANTTYSTSALGSVATTQGSQAYRAGIGTGVGKALDRLAQYYIKLAEQTFPIIEVDAGREVDVVLTKGVRVARAQTSARPTSGPAETQPGTTKPYLQVADDED